MMESSYSAPAVALVALLVFYVYEASQVNMYTRQRHGILAEDVADEYDYVIVGGGTAGCVLAARLSEDKNNRVLLLEAGGFYDENPKFPFLVYNEELKKTVHDWAYYTTPQKHAMFGMVDNRAYWPRGRVLGGSNMLSDGLYVRGSSDDYDTWAKNVGEEWSYRNVLPYILKSENIQSNSLRTSKYHNFRGQMAVSESSSTPLADLYLKSGHDLGYNITDYNGAAQHGFSKPQLNSRKGVRETTAVAILGRIRNRHNLSTLVNAVVTSIAVKGKKATGVNYIYNGKNKVVRATKDVILCAGAIKSPQLLMLSGIGPRDHLQEMKIPVIVDLPVGQNLQDHLAIPLMSKIKKGLGYSSEDFTNSWSKFQHRMFGIGPLSKSPKEGIAFMSTQGQSDSNMPDVQATLSSIIVQMDNFNYKSEILNELKIKFKDSDGFTFQLAITKPRSKGYLQLKSTDPNDQPVLNPQYLANSSDIENFIAGIRTWEKFIMTPTMKAIGAEASQMKVSFCEQHQFQSDAFWECMVRHLATTTHDQSCTCKMGPSKDPYSVVNSKLQVHGIKNLRVVDSSVFPHILGGNINAPTVMLAEKASDLIQGIDTVEIYRNNLPDGL